LELRAAASDGDQQADHDERENDHDDDGHGKVLSIGRRIRAVMNRFSIVSPISFRVQMRSQPASENWT